MSRARAKDLIETLISARTFAEVERDVTIQTHTRPDLGNAIDPIAEPFIARTQRLINRLDDAITALTADPVDDSAGADPVGKRTGDLDLYDDRVQAGIAWTLRQIGETLGLKTWVGGDGSETVEGDVSAEIHTILTDAGLYDPEDGRFATLPPKGADAEPVAKPAPFAPGGIGHIMYQAFNTHLKDYVLSTDGADYTPSDFEQGLIEDFFGGLMAEEAFFGPIRALYDTRPSPDASALREALTDAADFLTATFGPIDGDTSDKRRWSDEDACEVARKIEAALSQGEA